MPELPEVETVCRSLRPHLLGRTIKRLTVREPRLRVPVNKQALKSVTGRRVEAVRRIAKYVVIDLAGDLAWVFHLGMSGKLICVPSGALRRKHDHIVAALDDGRELRYHDPRRFGLSMVSARSALLELPQFRALGVDPFDPKLTGEYLFHFTRGSARRIRDLLLDQGIVAGLGNIYANEILALTAIKPTTRARRLTRSQAHAIAMAIPALLRDAIRWCGTSFSDYRDADDRSGEFQNHLRVYDRAGERCRVCRSAIKRLAVGNRSVFYCPRCQK
jgi:formamidopyrimidine-DNA glycosylase